MDFLADFIDRRAADLYDSARHDSAS